MNIRIDEKGKFYTPRVPKDSLPAFVRTNDQIIVGHVYVRPDKRLKDELNEDDSRFLPITNAQVYDAATETLLYHSNFLLLAYNHIVMLSPLEALADIRPMPWKSADAQEKPA